MQGVQYTPEKRRLALRRADEIGIQAAAAETGVSVSVLYAWRRNGRTFAPARVCDETKGLRKKPSTRIIDDDIRRRVIQIYNTGRSQRQIAELLGISQSEISRIISAARFAKSENDDGAVQNNAPDTNNNTSIDDLRKSIDDLKTAVELAVETLLDISERKNDTNAKHFENACGNRDSDTKAS